MKRKFSKVLWRDIAGVSAADNSGAWLTKKQAMYHSQKLFENEYISIGEIIGQTKDYIVIAATTDNDNTEDELYSEVSMIPKSVIIRITKL